MKTLKELTNTDDPAWPLIQEWASKSARLTEILPASASRGEELVKTQVTTRSPMGAVVYETGGILIDGGWLRILGSGNPKLTRTLPNWNQGRSNGFYLVADDVIGGFFAINGGGLGTDSPNIHYFAPESLSWTSIGGGYSAFLQWAFTGNLNKFYGTLRWPGWESDVAKVPGDRCLMTYPPLWTKEGRGTEVKRLEVPVEEAWGVQMQFRNALGSKSH